MTRIVIAATFTAEPLRDSLALLLKEATLAAEIEIAPNGQVFQQLLDPASSMQRNRGGINILMLRLEDWSRFGDVPVLDTEGQRRIQKASLDFLEALGAAGERGSAPQICVLCPPSPAALAHGGAAAFLSECEEHLCTGIRTVGNLQLLTGDSVTTIYPLDGYHDSNSDRLGHIPYTKSFFSSLGAVLARRAYALKTPPKKVIVLDCDQTLWKGVCGEVGPQGVEVDEPRRQLQQFMREKSQEGMLLCLCSKNNEEDALEVFRTNPGMTLQVSDLVSWRINWKAKSENLKALAQELQLGIDSFIFIDDDPVVCAEVRSALPEVFTLELPPDTAQIPQLLRHCWVFDRTTVTREDRDRTLQYQQNRERERLREKAASFDEFISTLNLQVRIAPLSSADVSRVSQLTFRTNQFNCTTVRRSESEILQFLQSPEAQCLVVEVSDRFGDYGLVGVMLFNVHGEELHLDSFLLSCRALGRGVEYRMLSELGRIAVEKNLAHVSVAFSRTSKNQPAWEFLDSIGAAYCASGATAAIFRFPAAVATSIRFLPSGPGQSADSSPAKDAVAPKALSATVNSADALLNIAAKYASVQQILEGLEPRILHEAATPSEALSRSELQLMRIWEETLRVQPIALDDDFFHIGGDSLAAVQVFSQIERTFNLTLSLATLFQAPTIRQLAHVLNSQGVDSTWSSLVPIQPNGAFPPLYCMHAAGGNVLFYRDLARYLGPDQPVLGLQTRGLHRKEVPHDRVEAMAECYLREIRTWQPDGPYHLAGSSFGGLVAYEVAQQLRRQGKQIAFLGLLDTYGPGYPKYLSSPGSPTAAASRVVDRILNHIKRVRLLEPKSRLPYLREKLRRATADAKRAYIYKRNEIERSYYQATGKALPRDLQRSQKAISKALRDYEPKPYEGKISLMRAANQPRGIQPDPFLGWKSLAVGGIDVFEVPGHHGAVTAEPYVGRLAEVIHTCLEGARHNDHHKISTLAG